MGLAGEGVGDGEDTKSFQLVDFSFSKKVLKADLNIMIFASPSAKWR